MKRGQLMSQPFMYIFAILIIGFLVVFGFLQVRKVLQFGDDVEDVHFKKNLQSSVDHVYNLAPGSSVLITREKISLPSSLRGICFIDASQSASLSKIPFPSIREDIELLGSTSNNVFFAEKSNRDRLSPFRINHLRPDGVVCFDTERSVEFVLYNKGDYVGLRAL